MVWEPSMLRPDREQFLQKQTAHGLIFIYLSPGMSKYGGQKVII